MSGDERVEVMGEYEGRIVMGKEKNMLGCCFDGEVREEDGLREVFVEMVEWYKRKVGV
ncbi:hypothetical protein [Bacillus altitudinis]|uniref:hypothetical protein n=1 Tax=Bacillus altitudinis TaxID=293387 RepID=UPI0016439B12|nr:hypothetical protein [Bacillus altitudinis]